MSRGLDNYEEEFLYRLLRPNEDPYKDIVCKDPNSNHNISQHVENGLKIPTRFISTTASFRAARDWIDTSHACRPEKYSDLERRNTIIKISVNFLKDRRPAVANSAYNFTDENVRCKYLVGIQHGYARRYEEVDFERTIPKEAITDIFVVGKGWIGTVPLVEQAAPIPTPVTANSSASTPTNNSVASTIQSSVSPLLQLSTQCLSNSATPSSTVSTQSLSITPSSTVSNISGLTDDSSITPQLSIPGDLTDVKTLSTFPAATQEQRGIKRRSTDENPVTPLKLKCYLQVERLEDIPNVCDVIEGGKRSPLVSSRVESSITSLREDEI